MAELDSNLDAVAAQIQRLVDGFDFTRPGVDKSLGRDLAAEVASGIRDRSVPDAIGPDGSGWPANEPKYAARKRAKYDADQPGVRTGQMLSLQSLIGRVAVSAEAVEMTYGIDAPPDSAFNGTDLTKGDQAVTDAQKGGWFTAQGRPFYALDTTIAGRVRDVAQDALDHHAKQNR